MSQRRWLRPAEQEPDVELVLEALGTLTSNGTVPGIFLDRAQLNRRFSPRSTYPLLQELRTYLRECCLVEANKTEYLDPLRGFLLGPQPLEIFTVNYDIVIEQFLERWGYPYFDGFDLFWSRERAKEDVRVNLHKLHGSATWFRTSSDRFLRIPTKAPETGLRLLGSEIAEPLMLYPAQKELYSGPFVDLLVHFKHVLESVTWMIVIGYSFRDDSMLRLFREAAARNPKLHLILVGPSSEETYQTKLSRVRIRAQLPPRKRRSGGRLRSPLVGRVTILPFRYGPILPDLASTIFPAIRESRATEANALDGEIKGQGPDWGVVVDKLLDALRVDRAKEIVRTRRLLESRDRSWKISYFARVGLLEAAFGHDPDWRVPWVSAEEMLRWQLIESVRVDPTFLGPAMGMIEIQFGFEPMFNERGEPQGYRMVTGQALHELFVRLSSFAARLTRYSQGCEREKSLTQLTRLVNGLERGTRRFYSPQVMVSEYLADARMFPPRISPRLAGSIEALRRIPSNTPLPTGKREKLAEGIRKFEVKRWSSMPWVGQTR